jgi:hypothetical protein
MCTPSPRPGAGFVDPQLWENRHAIGMDDDQLKNGCSMIIDPYGDILTECRSLGNEITVAVLTRDKLEKSGGYRYRKARKPGLYKDILGQANVSEQKVAWL